MDILNQIIAKLNKEEIRYFKLFSQAGQQEDQRKDICLFDYIHSAGTRFSEERALKKLAYTGGEKNSYYQLKNRLTENIGDSLAALNAHKQPLYEIFQFLQLSYIYNSRNLTKVSLRYLQKAERAALAIENYELLNVIYMEFIKLSANLPEIKPEVYVAKRDRNAVIVENLCEMDKALATLVHSLRLSQNFGPVDKKLLNKLQATVRTISGATTSGFGKNLEARVYNALSRIFLQQHNFSALENLAVQTYQKFEHEKWFDRNNHELKLQILTYCANALFKNGKHAESLKYADILGREIQKYDKLHYEKYHFFYCSILVNNYSETNPQKALEVLNEYEQKMRVIRNSYYDFYIYLNRATLLYDLGRYKESLKSLVHLYISEGYREADTTLKLKIEVCELIITFELGDIEALSYRLKQVSKTFGKLEKEKALQRDFDVIGILEAMSSAPDYKTDVAVQRRIKSFLKLKYGLDEADSEIIKYRPWLSSKLRNIND